ncbi:Pyridine nucleotide-disulfide oxidoreductase [Gracilaria domingensis]|nr:Pyridine nucleotide-disulfide oxidoreductase [Gracilaria domingensis]
MALNHPAFLTPQPLSYRRGAVIRAPRCVPRATVEPPVREAEPPVQQPVKRRARAPLPPRPGNLQVVLDRLSDTLLDAKLHYSRLFRRPPHEMPSKGPRVVVLGSGWAAHSFVKVVDHTHFGSVTVVSPRNFFFFTPLLSATAVGTIEFRSIVEPIRKANPFVDYYEAYAVDVDVERRVVKCEQGQREGEPSANAVCFQLPYDVLVVAVGEKTTTFGVEGARKYGYFLKEISDARRLRNKILDSLEKAALPMWSEQERKHLLHIVVVGGGPTGCEFAGELSDFVQKDLAPRYGTELVSCIRVTLLQSGKSLLTQFETSLQQLALNSFSGRVEVQFGARVTAVTDEEVVLQNGTRIRYGLLVWAAGNGTRPIVNSLMSKLDDDADLDDVPRRKKLPVDGWLRVIGLRNVFAMGDCAQIVDGALPSTAQVAGQQGAFLASKLCPSLN